MQGFSTTHKWGKSANVIASLLYFTLVRPRLGLKCSLWHINLMMSQAEINVGWACICYAQSMYARVRRVFKCRKPKLLRCKNPLSKNQGGRELIYWCLCEYYTHARSFPVMAHPPKISSMSVCTYSLLKISSITLSCFHKASCAQQNLKGNI